MYPLLAVETTTSKPSIALALNAEQIKKAVFPEHLTTGAAIAKVCIELFEKVSISSADIKSLAVDVGPGSFTGIRVGLSFAKGFCFGKNRGILPIVSLEAMAFQEGSEGREVAVAIDALQNQFYFAAYRHNGRKVPPQELASPTLINAEELVQRYSLLGEETKLAVVDQRAASELLKAADLPPEALIVSEGPPASAIAELGILALTRGIEPQNAAVVSPFYLKDFNVK